MSDSFESWMDIVIAEAKLVSSDVPVGAALFTKSGQLVSKSRNNRELNRSLLGHAESNAILQAWDTGEFGVLTGLTLVSTLEPCLVCASIAYGFQT